MRRLTALLTAALVLPLLIHTTRAEAQLSQPVGENSHAFSPASSSPRLAAKGPNDFSGKHPPKSGVTDLALPFAPGSIRVLVPKGAAIADVMAKFGLVGNATLVNHPPFSAVAVAAGLDRQWRVPVPPGREKEFVRLFAADPLATEFVEMDWIDSTKLTFAPNDSLYAAGYQGNLSALGMQSAWDVTIGTPNVVVAFIGTGIRASNEDLAGKQVTGRDFSVSPAQDVPPGTSHDPCDHETLVAGVGAASSNNGKGIASTGFNVSIMPIKSWSDSCLGRSTFYTRADAISWAFDHGAAVINLSYEHYDIDSAEQNIISAVYQYGGAVVASAGNDNKDTSVSHPYPCSDLYTFCIGASDNAGNRWKTADTQACPQPTPDPGTSSPSYCGSNFGSDVDYAVPGVGIWSTSNQADIGGAAYEAGTGTSIAAPQAAGVIGLLKSIGCSPQRDQDALYATSNFNKSPWTNFGFMNAGGALHWFGVPCPP